MKADKDTKGNTKEPEQENDAMTKKGESGAVYEDKGSTTCKEENSTISENGNEKDVEKAQAQAQETGTGELDALKAELVNKSKQCEEYVNTAQRLAAEFDNYKKRTAREKETLYSDAVCEVVAAFLPVVDSIERAIQIYNSGDDTQSVKGGVELVLRQAKDILNKLGVEEIVSEGVNFDPALHNAVIHVDDDSYGHNVIVEVLLKGYIFKDKVIRYSMVKVAN